MDCGFLCITTYFTFNADGFTITGVCRIPGEKPGYFSDSLCQIKWPNDIYCQGKKIAGILLEASGEIDSIDYLVVGIGINVNVRTNDFGRYSY